MDEYKPVTGELRKAFMANGGIATLDGCIIKEYMTIAKSELDDLCDNIDSVHAQLERDFDRLKVERDSMAAALDAAQGEHAYAPESHYVMLPKDADGVPIHVGDTVTCGRSVWQVTGLRLTGAAWSVCCTIFNDHGGSGTNVYPPCDLRHHVPDTWERIIMDAICGGDEDELVARCKALAGEK